VIYLIERKNKHNTQIFLFGTRDQGEKWPTGRHGHVSMGHDVEQPCRIRREPPLCVDSGDRLNAQQEKKFNRAAEQECQSKRIHNASGYEYTTR
jgi:hypothetical protein